jgi:hypothetical protein
MKKLVVAAILGTGFLISCTPKTPAVVGTKTITAEYLAQGKTIFDNSCGKCHDLPNPTAHSAQKLGGNHELDGSESKTERRTAPNGLRLYRFRKKINGH